MKLEIHPLKLYITTLPILIMALAGLLLNIFSWVWLWLYIPGNGEQLFLHYTILFGVDYIGTRAQAFIVPLSGLCILVANVFLGWVLFNKDRFIAYSLTFIAAFCQIFLVIAVLLLVFLNV